MGAVYGAGLLGHILIGNEDEKTKSEIMTLFVSVVGTSDQIREVIGKRVGEWSWNKADEKYGFRWLDAQAMQNIMIRPKSSGNTSLETCVRPSHLISSQR